jgi:hypothetical protein
LNKRPFKANSWFNVSAQKVDSRKVQEDFPPQIPKNSNSMMEQFSPSEFLIPGWNGGGLLSKEALSIQKTLGKLWIDAKYQFKGLGIRSKSLNISVYNEFLAYAHDENQTFGNLENHVDFWSQLMDPKAQDRQKLDEFINIYCFRSVTAYLYKLQFIISLAEETGFKYDERSLLNPNAFLGKIFKKGSSTELACESLQANQYSWYRPSANFCENVDILRLKFHQVSITEMQKICTYRPKLDKASNLEFEDSEYSHSLSHVSFGLFINNLLLFLPRWAKGNKTNPFTVSNLGKRAKVLNTKFAGDNLSSMTHSHWLAQESNINLLWDEIVCPDFIGKEYKNGQFLKICHELKFLTFLVKMSNAQDYDPVTLICQTMSEKYSKNAAEVAGQMSMFPKYEVKNDLVYERIILNINSVPKKNPHHYLIGQINSQFKQLDANGYLIVFSNQKFFVPSQAERIEQLLQTFKLETFFNLENLKGKGEIPNYIYVFTKKPSLDASGLAELFKGRKQTGFRFQDPHKKESCLSFRFTGELTHFKKFNNIVEELESFFDRKCSSATPIYQNELEENLTFEFYQDAIIEGKLLSSTSGDSDRITHPNFFKNLTKTCSPFDQFFQIESLSLENKRDIPTGFLGISFKEEDRFPFILIINHSNPTNIEIELIGKDSYRAKSEQYGMAFFQYFGLIPKHPDLNINLFREFFSNPIGQQIIQLSLNGGFTKLKGKLKSLLIPSFFGLYQSLNRDVESSLDYFKTTSDDFIKQHPDEVLSKFKELETIIFSLSKSRPWAILSLLSNFKSNLSDSIDSYLEKSKLNKAGTEHYSNPLILEPLLKSKKSNIYPKNQEVFVDLQIEDRAQIHLPLTHCQVKAEGENHFIELSSGEHLVVRLFSDPVLLSFIKFILSNSNGVKISELLTAIAVPRITELKEILENYSLIKSSLEQLLGDTDSIINKILTTQISLSPR